MTDKKLEERFHKIYEDFYIERMRKFWPKDSYEPDFISVIAATYGWNPLDKDQEMTIGYHGKKYHIKRIE